MSENSVSLRIKINFPVVFTTVLVIHALLLMLKGLPEFNIAFFKNDPPTVLKIRQVKSEKVDHPFLKTNSSALNKTPPGMMQSPSLRDLGIPNPSSKTSSQTVRSKRPGTIPEITKKPRTLDAISLKGNDFKSSYPSTAITSKSLSSGGNRVNDAVVSIEVPDGIEPDELNKYELMFYSFQKRTAMAYANSILSNLDKFNRRYPNYKLKDQPQIVMTARMTFDEKGNVRQIKMVRWTHVDEIQNFFEDVVKDMDQLHNPPKALWEKDGEFSMFFTLEILNG